jgi:S-adenosylmethionine/arginine decarboxylase-like enzyme
MAETIQIEIPAPVETKPWGFHAIMDCSDVELAKIQDADNIRAWIADLLVKIDMVPVGDPIVSLTGIGMPDKEGYTAIQVIVTSSIVAHFIDQDRHIYIDVFSCKEFNPQSVEDSIKQFFGGATQIKKILLPRNAGI